jgi:hypothetical protein
MSMPFILIIVLLILHMLTALPTDKEFDKIIDCLRQSPKTGFDIAQQTRLGFGTIYPVLHLLVKREIAEEYYAQKDGVQRKYYRLKHHLYFEQN